MLSVRMVFALNWRFPHAGTAKTLTARITPVMWPFRLTSLVVHALKALTYDFLHSCTKSFGTQEHSHREVVDSSLPMAISQVRELATDLSSSIGANSEQDLATTVIL